MRVIEAAAMGMCFGVRRALAILDRVRDPRAVTVHGELVHNEVVLARLSRRGFRMSPEDDLAPLPRTPAVLVTAHGVSDRERRRLRDAGKRILDTTCPLVRRAHRTAKALADAGRHVVVLGKPGHVEVRGLTGDLPSFDVVPDVSAVRRWPHPRIGVVCQTTTPDALAADLLLAVRERNPGADVRFVDTVCRPTRDRQRALEDLLSRVPALVVVGGRNSNNTRRLADRARERGLPTFHVGAASELRPAWFAGLSVVGLTAGTSTLPDTVARVRRALEAVPSSPLSQNLTGPCRSR